MAEAEPTAVEIPPERVGELEDAQIVDVRTDAEWEDGHLADARHVPLDELPREAESLDQGRPVVFYCRVGERSAVAAQAFRASGWDAYSIEGGLVAWAERGLPVEGQVGLRSNLPGL
jgi:rhodanese-related sulfurtransferase